MLLQAPPHGHRIAPHRIILSTPPPSSVLAPLVSSALLPHTFRTPDNSTTFSAMAKLFLLLRVVSQKPWLH
jgi:hypothetical protein